MLQTGQSARELAAAGRGRISWGSGIWRSESCFGLWRRNDRLAGFAPDLSGDFPGYIDYGFGALDSTAAGAIARLDW